MILSNRIACCIALAALGACQAEPPSTAEITHYPERLLWGDTHVHSRLSMDAHIYGNNHLGPDAAYRFAKGEQVTLADGSTAQLKRPLDFLVVADHAEYLGVRVGLAENDAHLLEHETGQRWHHHMTSPDGDSSVPLLEFADSLRKGESLMDIAEFTDSVWKTMIEYGEAAYQPGTFTTLFGYEWSAMPDSQNLHRVVVFRDGPERVSMHRPFSALDSSEPEDLWAVLDEYEVATGGRVLTIPHNPNISGGKMFSDEKSDGQKIDKEYAETRAHFEKILEVTQVKGDSETHPFLSPDDEFADFERWDKSNIGMIEPHRDEWFKGEYAREALKRGLQLENEIGINPFQFGLIGSTDQHNSLSDVNEQSFPGKFTVPGTGPDRWDFTVGPETLLPQVYYEWELAAAGYAGVWAHENTREAIFDALSRRETFATTGPRISVRFFAAASFNSDWFDSPDWLSLAYDAGVPMGAVMALEPGQAPHFLLSAEKDPQGANLDRIQVIKGWVDSTGEAHEQVYDAILSDPARRNGSQVRIVGNTVNAETASYTNSIGAEMLRGVWSDPDFSESHNAFYYLRVLEIPTPRWTSYAVVEHHSDALPDDVPNSQQERAYTSPIWVNVQ